MAMAAAEAEAVAVAAKRKSSTCNFSLQKCKKVCLNDRISEMPDEILHSILSRLTIKEAARTSILSHRWKNLWKFISVLNFDGSKTLLEYIDYDLLEDERVKFAKWVNQVLRSHYLSSSVVTVEELIICFDLPNRYGFVIDHWLKFARKKRVQRLDLNASPLYMDAFGRSDQEDIYKPSPPSSFLFRSLTSLKLEFVAVTDEHFENLSSNSPFLESLCINFSPDLRNLRIVGPSIKLKYLEVIFCSQLKLIEISSAIYFVSFKYFGDEISLRFKNLPQLVDMCLRAPFLIHGMASHFSSYLCQIEKLVLYLSRQCRSKSQEFPEFPTLSNLRHLELYLYGNTDADPRPIMYILKASPFIHSFKLEIDMSYYNSPTKVPERKGPKVWKSYGPYRCLKVLEFAKFVGDIIDIDVAMHLIENATSLEKLIITPDLALPSIPSEFREREKQLTRECAVQLGSKLPPVLYLVCQFNNRGSERKGPKVWKSYGPYRYLKVVEFVKFVGDIIDIDVAMHLIENATSLEKLIITPRDLAIQPLEVALTRECALQLGSKLPPGVELLILYRHFNMNSHTH